MSLPIGPVWSILHLGIKYPIVAVGCVAGVLTMTSDEIASPLHAHEPDFVRIVPESGPMVALTFDDGWRSVTDVALPMMSQRGMIGTNYITSGFVDSWVDPRGYISRDHIREFTQAGWEIGAHSIQHDDLTTLSPEMIEANMVQPYNDLTEWTGQHITSMSTPFGSYNDTVIRFAEITYGNHVNAYGPARGLNTLDNFDLFNINRIDTQIASVDEVCSTVQALGQDEFYVLIFHKIDESGDDYSLTPRDFGRILDCVGASDAQVVTISDGAESMLRRLEN